MLKSLFIKDYALIENIQIEFGKGLNIITGETGAGKSILIGAMSLLLGERASTDVIRKGSEKSIVEGIFNVSGNRKIENLCSENNIDFNNDLIVRREVSLKGTNRCFLNDSPVTLNLIKEVGDLLVDLHGQHEHQSLLRPETHIEMLDQFANLDGELTNYKKSFNQLSAFLKELKDLQSREQSIKEKRELYEFQIKEIDAVNPQLNEEDKLTEELKILENAEKLLNTSSGVYELLYENENSIQDQLGLVRNRIAEIERIDKSFSETLNNMESVLAMLNEISTFIRSYKERIDLEPERLEAVRERLGVLTLLKKKYGGSLVTVLNHREKIGKEYDLAENFSHRIFELDEKINSKRKECGLSAKIISQERKAVAKKIKKEIEETLKHLGITDSKFEVKIINVGFDSGADEYILVENKKYHYNENGFDNVEYFISTNIGEDLKPLIKVASGGEVSRIMLALKTILAKSDKLPILIFDEIDTGISGRIAQKVGQALKELAAHHQIIAITHLPQIAALADSHYSVEKKKISERIVSSISKLEMKERVEEVAKLISGEIITEASLKGARELINYQN
jgi:DNA repair protein RecN (Recombination protein N)